MKKQLVLFLGCISFASLFFSCGNLFDNGSSDKDTTVPVGYSVIIDQSVINASNTSAFSFTLSNAEIGTTCSYIIDDEDSATSAVTGSSAITATDLTISGIDVSPLSDGNISLTVSLTDAAGNVGESTSIQTVAKDTVAPSGYSAVIGQSIISSDNATAMSFALSGAEAGATCNYTINDENSANSAVTGTVAVSALAQNVSGIDVSSLSDGTLYLTVSLTDAAGNQGLATTEVTVLKDTIAPDNQNTVISADATLYNDETLAIASSGDEDNTIWLAPYGTTSFIEGAQMTKASGIATSISVPTAEGTYYIFVIDGAGNISPESTYEVVVELRTYSFSNASATGRQGPDQSAVDSAYLGTLLNGDVTVTDTGIQKWTVPKTATYRITAMGASGANAGSYGKGAKIEGDFELTAGDILWILVGQQGGGLYKAYAQMGGGGGSFVSTGTSLPDSSLLMAAGGGGAAGANANAKCNGQASTAGSSGYDHDDISNNDGGADGTAGDTGANAGMDAAAGILKEFSLSTEAQSFFDGGLGSEVTDSSANNGDGGFGGGGARISGTGYATSGGGGGYSGGGASDDINGMPFYGGGGGSYNTGTNQSNTAGGADLGHGSVTIIQL